MPHIFDLFAQTDYSLARTQGGLGIGLTVVKRLVEMHRGSVEAYSQGTRLRTEFVVHLPRCEAPANEEIRAAAGKPAQDPANSVRILVVDDNPNAAETMAMLLRHEGFTVATAFEGPGALAEAARFQPRI